MLQLVLQVTFWALGLPLSLLVIAALLRGGYRLFPVLFVYQIVDFLMTVAGMPTYIAYYFYHDMSAKPRMADWWSLDELLLQPLVYAVVVSLIYRATRDLPSRRVVRAVLIGGAALIAAASFLYHHQPNLKQGEWMAFWMRDLTFSSAILDLALWGLLLASKVRDTQVLLVSGALGIQFTGEAIGESLRSMSESHRSHALSFAGSLVTTIVDLLSVYIMWQAFRNSKSRDTKRAAV